MPGKLRRHNDYGHIHFLTISCYRRLQFFRFDSIKMEFIEAMKHVREKLNIRWIAYVIMPEHVHLLVYPTILGVDQPISISSVLQHLKQRVGRQGKQRLREVWAKEGNLGSDPLNRWALGSGDKPFWKTRAYDFNVINEKTLYTKLDYVHKNPISRRLVERAEDWTWSSYRFYEFHDESLIAMDWNGEYPIQ